MTPFPRLVVVFLLIALCVIDVAGQRGRIVNFRVRLALDGGPFYPDGKGGLICPRTAIPFQYYGRAGTTIHGTLNTTSSTNPCDNTPDVVDPQYLDLLLDEEVRAYGDTLLITVGHQIPAGPMVPYVTLTVSPELCAYEDTSRTYICQVESAEDIPQGLGRAPVALAVTLMFPCHSCGPHASCQADGRCACSAGFFSPKGDGYDCTPLCDETTECGAPHQDCRLPETPTQPSATDLRGCFCEAGFEQTEDRASCVPSISCPAGTYRQPNLDDGVLTCALCPAGFSCDYSVANLCPENAFAPEGSAECQPIPDGFVAVETQGNFSLRNVDWGQFTGSRVDTRTLEVRTGIQPRCTQAQIASGAAGCPTNTDPCAQDPHYCDDLLYTECVNVNGAAVCVCLPDHPDCDKSGAKSFGLAWIIVIGVGAGAVLLVLLAYFFRRKKKQEDLPRAVQKYPVGRVHQNNAYRVEEGRDRQAEVLNAWR